MYELNCAGIIPGCARIIRAETEVEVFGRAVNQARTMGYARVPTVMLDRFRMEMIEIDDVSLKTAV